MLAAIRRRLTPDILPMGCVIGAGTPSRVVRRLPAPTTPTSASARPPRWPSTTTPCLRRTSKGAPDRTPCCGQRSPRRPGRCVLHPVFAGSAATGAGVPELMAGISDAAARPTAPDPSGEPSGRVFKVERGAAGEKVAYVRMFSGSVGAATATGSARRSAGQGHGRPGCSSTGDWVRTDAVASGQIGRLQRPQRGPGRRRLRCRGIAPRSTTSRRPRWRRRSTAVRPETRARRCAGTRPARRPGPPDRACAPTRTGCPRCRSTVASSRRCIAATLAEEHGIEVEFADARVLHVERPRGVGSAVERLNTESNPYHATIGLRIGPGRPGSGLTFVVDAPAHDMPLYLFQQCRGLRCGDRQARPPRPGPRPLRVAGDRLRGDPGRVRLQHLGRAAVQAGTAQHVLRLPEADADRGRAGAGPGSDRGLRARAAGAARGADRGCHALSSASSPVGERRW